MRLAIAAVFLSAGCVLDAPARVWRVDDPELLEAAQCAADGWCEASAGQYCPAISATTESEHQIYWSPSGEMPGCAYWWPGDLSGLHPERISVDTTIDRSGCVIRAGSGCAQQDRAGSLGILLAHELGHSLIGRGHADRGLMQSHIECLPSLDPSDWGVEWIFE